MIRLAKISDLSQLTLLEGKCFLGDRFSRRIFRYLLTQGHAKTWVAEKDNVLYGYTTLLFRKGSKRARLYSIAVSPEKHGFGIGHHLLNAAETGAKDHGCNELELEVREDNIQAIQFYEKAGYHFFGKYKAFYEDKMDALRFQKKLSMKLPSRGNHGH